jgi:osmotically-inducible protein OsmY
MHMKTDSQLQQDVLAELAWEPSVNAADVGVEVKDGIVTLAGHVRSFVEKWEAERAAQRVSGVRGLAVEMDVNLPGSSRRNDVDIVRSVENALQWMTYVPQGAIKVLVESGWVTLTGEVAWEYQRKAATDGVRGLMGVTGVSDQISIKHMASSNGVKADIEAALKRRAHTDGQNISVEVHGADVTLRGRVHSWSERDLVASCAWGSAGVHTVSDNITVSPY